MIKIHKQLWYVITSKDKDSDLAYMTYYEENEAFNKRKATGLSWATPSNRKYNYETRTYEDVDVLLPTEVITDNNPTKGFYIGSSVSRWSTSNKLFRVKDPRGFTVEVPTDNIATLLHHCTVINGVVQEECVWGREGSNHVLLPVNSQPYLDTLDKMDILANKLISLKDLKEGDWVKLFEDQTEYYYVGRVKPTWEIKPYTYAKTHWSFPDYSIKNYDEPYEATEGKYRDLFLHKSSSGWNESGVSAKPKIVEVLRNDPIPDDELLQANLYYNRDYVLKSRDHRWQSDRRLLNLGRKK